MFGLANDFETHALIAISDKIRGVAMQEGTSTMGPDEMAKLQTHIRARKEMVRLGVMRCPSWFQEELNKLDSKMRAWWDSWKEEWTLDRLQEEGFYITVLHFKPTPTYQLSLELIDLLRKHDLQRYSDPKEYVRKVREQAEQNRQAREAENTDKVLAAVDGMSSRQISDFIKTTEAVQSGETIRPYGDDAKWLERAENDKKAALARGEDVRDNPTACLNPGMDPRIYKRTPRKEAQ